METIAIRTRAGKNGRISFSVPPRLRNHDVEMVVVINDTEKAKSSEKRYDFSDLAGKLRWKGNSVKEQRRLRSEWR